MATFKTISDGNIQTTRNVLNQLVDFVAEDISGSAASNLTRKKYEVFVTGASGPGVTSSLFQTVFDQNYALQTSNELFDMTIGIFDGSSVVANSTTGNDFNSKRLFPSSSLMMREKISNYSQFAQILLGDSTARFTAPFSEATAADNIDVALFMPFKRLFTRDGIKRETFAMRFFQSASNSEGVNQTKISSNIDYGKRSTTDRHSSGSVIYTDVGSAAQVETSPAGGSVGNIVNSANTNETVGLLFYDYGIAIFDLKKIVSGSQIMSGTIDTAYTPKPTVAFAGIGKEHKDPSDPTKMVMSGKFIPDFVVSASIDNIVDHLAFTRFGSGSETFLTFQNNTFINSTLYFCRATADEFNFSTNPTYKDSDGRIVVIDSNQEGLQKSFTFVTTVGLYNANEDLLAVAKLSRPVMKNDEKDLTFRVRLDF